MASSARGRRLVVRADQPGLAHVRHVEETGFLAGMAVLGDDAGGILDRHLVAGERHEARTELAVQIRQGRGKQGRGKQRSVGVIGHVVVLALEGLVTRTRFRIHAPPLS